MKKILFFFIILISVLFFVSCGNEPPVINSPNYYILVYQKGSLGMPQDSIFLSVYFNIEDENGMDDITDVKITHIETEYSWELPLNSLNNPYVWKENSYSGYPFLEYNGGKTILTGEYLIEAHDKAGNFTESSFIVEMPGYPSNKPYELSDIKYKIEIPDKKELKISNSRFNSCDVKTLNNNAYFNGERKNFKENQKIILNNDPMPLNTIISVRVNSDPEEKIIYFLKDYIIM